MHLGGVEPQPRQFVPRPALTLGRLAKAIPAGVAVVLNGRVQPVAQVFDVALEGRARHLQFVEKIAQRHQLAVLQQLLNAIKAFGAVHGCVCGSGE